MWRMHGNAEMGLGLDAYVLNNLHVVYANV